MIFIGKFDENLFSLEERVMQKFCDNQDTINKFHSQYSKSINNPDLFKYPMNEYKIDSWNILGNVKPTFLLKNLISQMKIVFLVFNLSKSETLDFLISGWGLIFDKLDSSKQEIYLIGTEINPNDQNLDKQIQQAKAKFNYIQYYKVNMQKQKSINNFLQFIQAQLGKISGKDNQNALKMDEIGTIERNYSKSSKEKAPTENSTKDDMEEGNLEDDEEEEANESKSKDKDKDEETTEFKDYKYIRYKLFMKRKVAEIINSPDIKEEEVTINNFTSYDSNEYKITSIGEKAFDGSTIKSLLFDKESKVRKIRNYAFENSQISKLYIPSSVEKLDEYWCKGADNLNEIKVGHKSHHFSKEGEMLIYSKKDETKKILFIPRNFSGEFKVQEGITHIGHCAFFHVNNLQSFISSASSLKCVNSSCFYECQNLINATFEKSPSITLSGGCFYNSPKLSTVNFNCKEVNIGRRCFNSCSSLTTVKFTGVDNLTVSFQAFGKCSSLKSFALNNMKIVKFGKECFDGSDKLESVGINADSIYLGDKFINNCQSLSTLQIESSQKFSISSQTFGNCQSLKTINFISSSEIELSENCFEGLINLKNVELSTKSFNINNKVFYGSRLKSLYIKVESSLDLSKDVFSSLHFLDKFSLISNSKIILNNGFMCNAQNIHSITLTAHELEISESCFTDCTYLCEFEIKESGSVSILPNQFFGCPNLQQILIESNQKKEDGSAFNVILHPQCFINANSLKYVFIKGGDALFCEKIFGDNSSISEINISHAQTVTFDAMSLHNCQSISKVHIEASQSIVFCHHSFALCNNLRSIELMGPELTVERLSFLNCSSLEYLYLTKFDKILFKHNAFEGCTGFRYISIGAESKFTTGSSCFENCSSVTTLQINCQNEVSLGSNSFKGCQNVEKINVTAKSSFTACESCFAGLKNLTYVVIDSKNVDFGKKCFDGCSKLSNISCASAETIYIFKKTFQKNYKKFITCNHNTEIIEYKDKNKPEPKK